MEIHNDNYDQYSLLDTLPFLYFRTFKVLMNRFIILILFWVSCLAIDKVKKIPLCLFYFEYIRLFNNLALLELLKCTCLIILLQYSIEQELSSFKNISINSLSVLKFQ